MPPERRRGTHQWRGSQSQSVIRALRSTKAKTKLYEGGKPTQTHGRRKVSVFHVLSQRCTQPLHYICPSNS
eukprot:482909-Heterocapsa_arctica.AAC.1